VAGSEIAAAVVRSHLRDPAYLQGVGHNGVSAKLIVRAARKVANLHAAEVRFAKGEVPSDSDMSFCPRF
jgi:hypothetical protein